MSADQTARPVAFVGLKSYLTHQQTLDWFEGLFRMVGNGRAEGIDVIVAPSVTAVASLAPTARKYEVALAAQDCSLLRPGGHTGELPAALLRELGVEFVEVGHIERRRDQGESDHVVARKVARVVEQGMQPFVCVGEESPGDTDEIIHDLLQQLRRSLAFIPEQTPVLLAYEPVWAIGQAEPAPPEHIREITSALRELVIPDRPGTRILYGGTAGPGVFSALAGTVDGLALGRRVHDIAAMGRVLDEIRTERNLYV